MEEKRILNKEEREALYKIRGLQRLMGGVFFIIPIFVLAFFITPINGLSIWIFISTIDVFIILFIVLLFVQFAILRCPRCLKYFHTRGPWTSLKPWARECQNCGLSIKGVDVFEEEKPPTEEEIKGIRKINARSTWWIISLLGALPALFFFSLIIKPGIILFLIFIFLFGISPIINYTLVMQSRCPRCGNNCRSNWNQSSFYKIRCDYCGLRLK